MQRALTNDYKVVLYLQKCNVITGIFYQIFIHADDSRGSKAFSGVCMSVILSVCLSVCLSVRTITQKRIV